MTSNPREFYEANGYYVFPKLIPEQIIENILEKYKGNILPSPKPFFRQSSNRWEGHKISEYGYMIESLRSIHDYADFPDFSEAARQIIGSQQVMSALIQLTGSTEHNVMQSFFFDLNAATPAHQDSYYLDSFPGGYLLAGWFALEDIKEEAGRFYVMPGSHLLEFDLTSEEKASNGPYMKKLKNYLESHKENIHAPALKKGDVLFWNSGTIHGSLATVNSQYSRKSMTAHYLPSQYQFGKGYCSEPRPIDYKVYGGVKYRAVHPLHSRYSLKAKLITDLWQYVHYQPTLARLVRWMRKGKPLE